MKIAEIFTSIQGESTYSGFPCTFVRVTGCNLRCTYCDTPYAFEGGEVHTVEQIVDEVRKRGVRLVELTGGEPLLQEESYALMDLLKKEGCTVLLETNGSISLEKVDEAVVKIVDCKCPGSGMVAHVNFSNIRYLSCRDEVKFVIGDREDFSWACEIVSQYGLIGKCEVLFSPVYSKLAGKVLAGWILEKKLPVRLQLQLHKIIWPEMERGV